MIGTREAAAFWHVPGWSAKVPGLVRAGSVRIPTPEPLFVVNDEERKRAALVGLELTATAASHGVLAGACIG